MESILYKDEPILITKEEIKEASVRVSDAYKIITMGRLREKFNIPEGMEELAYQIWLEGKED